MYNKINDDLISAMKEKDAFRLSVLRMIKSALIYEKTNGTKSELYDEDVINVLKKQLKTRKESVSEYTKYNRMDLVDNLNKEIDIINEYLPLLLGEEEINKILDDLFNELKPSSMKDMGMIMKRINEMKINADMSLISQKIKERLS